jgi:hypothetical protein
MGERSWTSVVETTFRELGELSDFFIGLVLNFGLIVGVVAFQWNLVESQWRISSR